MNDVSSYELLATISCPKLPPAATGPPAPTLVLRFLLLLCSRTELAYIFFLFSVINFMMSFTVAYLSPL